MKHYILFAFLIILLCGCSKEKQSVETSWMTMGTFASLTLAGESADQLEELSEKAVACFESINDSLSIYNPNSELSRVNIAAGMHPVQMSPASLKAIRLSLKYAKLSGGCFDPTVAPLVQLWGFSGGNVPAKIPSDKTIAEMQDRVGYNKLTLKDNSAFLNQPEMKIDLGGIAKGYAVDLCYEALTNAVSTGMLINLGGNMRCHGKPNKNRPWRIGVRNPFDGTKTIGSLEMKSGMAVATSGNYEQFVMIDEKRHSHLIDPRTGRPSRGMAGVTVLSTTATEADALSTALFIMGIKGSQTLLANLPTSEAIFIPDKKPMEIWITPGLENIFSPNPEHAEQVRVIQPMPDI